MRTGSVKSVSDVIGPCKIDRRIGNDGRTVIIRTPSTDFDSGSQIAAPLDLGRQMLAGLTLVDSDVIESRRGQYRSTKYAHTFRDDQGLQYQWYGTNPTPLSLSGYRYPGRYRVLPGVPLTFPVTVREIWSDGTVSICRPYIRLDRQPEATRRIYAQQYGIPLEDLDLEGIREVA